MKEFQIDGFCVFGESGNWEASSSDCSGWGRTRDAAIKAALRLRRENRVEDERNYREERKIDDLMYGADDEADDDDDDDWWWTIGGGGSLHP